MFDCRLFDVIRAGVESQLQWTYGVDQTELGKVNHANDIEGRGETELEALLGACVCLFSDDTVGTETGGGKNDENEVSKKPNDDERIEGNRDKEAAYYDVEENMPTVTEERGSKHVAGATGNVE